MNNKIKLSSVFSGVTFLSFSLVSMTWNRLYTETEAASSLVSWWLLRVAGLTLCVCPGLLLPSLRCCLQMFISIWMYPCQPPAPPPALWLGTLLLELSARLWKVFSALLSVQSSATDWPTVWLQAAARLSRLCSLAWRSSTKRRQEPHPCSSSTFFGKWSSVRIKWSTPWEPSASEYRNRYVKARK